MLIKDLKMMIKFFAIVMIFFTTILRASKFDIFNDSSEENDVVYRCTVHTGTAVNEVYIQALCENPDHEVNGCLSRWISNNPKFPFVSYAFSYPFRKDEAKYIETIKKERDVNNLIQFLKYTVTRKFSLEYYSLLINEIKAKKRNWNVNESFEDGRNLINFAGEHLPAIKALVLGGADVNQLGDEIYGKLMICAVNNENESFADYLFKAGGSRNFVSILNYAIHNNKVVKYLIKKGVDLSSTQFDDHPLRLAINRNLPSTFKYLLEKGKINLHFDLIKALLLESFGIPVITTLLLNYESEAYDIIDVMTGENCELIESPLFIKDTRNFKLFIDKVKQKQPNWEMNEKFKGGKILMQLALREGNLEIVEYLKCSGVNEDVLYEIQFDKVMKDIENNQNLKGF